MPIKRHVLWRANKRECVRVRKREEKRKGEKEELLPWAAALLPYAAECVRGS
jgi:hypothetical protein